VTDIDHLPPAAPAPAWLGQGTAVEQSRAVAEVQGAIVVAQQVPRSIDRARAALQQTCAILAFAERAFYDYPRGGETVTGPTIQFARAAASWWGNVQYGIAELRRDDENAMSEMMAFAWDVQANTRATTTFLVPHLRDRKASKGGPVKLVDLRDIYENNANQGSRRLREQILGVLPAWFVAEGLDICRATLHAGDKRPFAERQQAAVDAFEKVGVDQARLEQKLGRPVSRWTIYDLTQLRITLREIETGAVMVDDAFPPMRVTASEIKAQAELMAPSAAEGQQLLVADGAVYAPDDPERPFTEGS